MTETECTSTSEEKCETAYEEQCTTVYDQQCSSVPGQQQCVTVNDQVRNLFFMLVKDGNVGNGVTEKMMMAMDGRYKGWAKIRTL